MAALKKANQDKSVAMSFFMRTPFGFIKAQGLRFQLTAASTPKAA